MRGLPGGGRGPGGAVCGGRAVSGAGAARRGEPLPPPPPSRHGPRRPLHAGRGTGTAGRGGGVGWVCPRGNSKSFVKTVKKGK